MAAVSWKTGISADWSVAADWSNNLVPGATDAVSITAVGTYTVAITDARAAASLTVNSAGATVTDTGTLALTGALALTAGTFTLGSSGVLSGGTVAVGAGSTLVAGGGTLSDVTWQGTLDLSANNSILAIAGGLTLTGAGGTGAGTVELTGSGDHLYVTTSTTLDNATVDIGNNSNWDYLQLTSSAVTLTLGPALDLQQVGIYTGLYSNYSNDVFINQGTIAAGISGGQFVVTSGTLINQGHINVTNGDSFNAANSIFNNTGTVAVNGGVLTLGSWSSTGKITATAGSVLNLGGAFTTAQLKAIVVNGATVNLTGALDNTAATLSVGTGSSLGAVGLTGTITGGAVADAGGGIVSSGGTLSGVTYRGTLDLSANYANLRIADTLKLTGAGGTGTGTVQFTGYDAYLYINTSMTLDNATINIGNVSYWDFLYQNAATETLTLGAHLTLQQVSTYAQTYSPYAGDTIINKGTINAGATGGQFVVSYGSFVNQGHINVSNGETFSATNGSFSNTGTIAVDGGVLSLGTWSNTGKITLAAGSTLNLGGTVTTAQLNTLTLTGATVNITGTLDNTGGTLSIGPGGAIAALELTGTVENGVIVDTGGGLIGNNGTLSNVAYRGTLDLSANYAAVRIAGGVTFAGANGSGPGTVQLTGYGDYLYITNSTTLNNATINFGNNSTYSYLYTSNSGVTLTLGPKLNLIQAGLYAQIYEPYSGDTVINAGTITADRSGGQFYVSYGSFANTGRINVSNGDTFNLATTIFSNSGTLAIDGGVLTLGTWSNTGKITANASSVLNFGGAFTTAQLKTVTTGGATLNLGGTLNNAGGVLTIGTGTAIGTIGLTGTINGGVIADAGGGLVASGGTLSAVTYRGALNLGADNASLRIAGSLKLTGPSGSGAGAVNLTGYNAYLYLNSSMTLDNATIDIGNNSSWDYLYLANTAVTLTLGANLDLQQTGTYAQLYAPYSGDRVINKGTIAADGAGSRFLLSYGTLTNQGTLSAYHGATLDLTSLASFTNLAGTLLTGGVISVGAGSTLEFANNVSIVNDRASITLDGAGSVIQAYNTASGMQVAIDSTLAQIGAGGTLALLDGRDFTAVAAGGTFIDSGKLLLGGGTFSATKLTLSNGTIAGTGTISGAVGVAGAATIADGAIVITGAVSGPGTLSVAAGAAVFLGLGGNMTGHVNDAGTIQLAGKTFTSAAMTIAATGVLTGFGTVAGPITDNGLIDATGGTLSVTGLAGIAGGTWSGAQLEADARSALKLADNTTIASDAGGITLSGTGSVIESLNTTTSALVSLDTTLGTIAAGGTLALLAGRSFTTVANGGTFTDSGALVLDGGTFGATQLLLNNGAMVSGSGTLATPVAVSGNVGLGGGTLVVGGAVSGTGTLGVAADAVLVLNAGGPFAGTLNDAGVVQLAGATFSAAGIAIGATGTLAGFGTVSGPVTGAGLVDAAGGTLVVAGLGNLSGGTLTAGQLEADAGATLQLADNTSISVDAGSITLAGAASVIEALNTTTSAQVLLDSTLATIKAGGTLAILDGRSFAATATSGNFTDSGVLNVDGGTFSATKLTITATGTLLDAGTVTASIVNSGIVSVTDGTTLTLTGGGNLGGTFTGDGTLRLTGGTAFKLLSATTLSAGLVQVAAGSKLNGAGTIASPLEVAGTVTAQGGTLELDGALSGTGTLTAAAGAVLHLADGGTFFGTVNGAGAVVNDDLIGGGRQGVSLAGAGTLRLTNSAGAEIDAGNGDAVVLAGGTDIVTNAGAIGGTRHGLVLSGASSTVTNSGLISGDDGAAILGSGPGTLSIDNTGLIVNYEGVGIAALSLNGASSAVVTNAGTIIGGYWLDKPGVAIQFGAGNDRLVVLPGAAFIGTVSGGGGNNTLELAAGASASAPGTISGLGSNFTHFASVVTDANAAWVLAGTNVLSTTSTIAVAAGGTLTLAGSMTMPGGAAIGGAGSFVVSATGTLRTGPNGGATNTIGSGSFGNQGLIDVISGKTLAIGSANFSNLAGGALTGGTFEMDGAATLQLGNDAALVTDNASIVLNGAGGTIQWLDTSTSSTVTLAQSLGTIGTAGALHVWNGASFVSPGTITDQGLLDLDNATFTASTLAVTATGTAFGTGTINGTITDQGLVEASGGTLALAGAVTGSGTIGIDANAVLSASGQVGVASVAFLDGEGTLALAQPGLFTAAISGFGTSDTIDLLGTVVTGTSFANNTLTLTGAGGTIGSLTFTGDYSGYHFGHYGDGNGGTNLLLI